MFVLRFLRSLQLFITKILELSYVLLPFHVVTLQRIVIKSVAMQSEFFFRLYD